MRVSVEATCRGVIVDVARGNNAPWLRPAFPIPSITAHSGELRPLVKRCLSHRARAFARAIPLIVQQLDPASI